MLPFKKRIKEEQADEEIVAEKTKEPSTNVHVNNLRKIDLTKMNVSAIIESTAAGSTSPTDTNITLWQFLLELLTHEKHCDIIQWTKSREGEFKLIDAEAVARLWGQRKAKPHMNYDKLSRALRYYYEKNIIKKVIGQKFVYRFVTQNNQSQNSQNSYNQMSSPEYQTLKPSLDFVKEEKDFDISRFLPPTSSETTSFSALSLVNTSSPPSGAHSVATPSPSDSTCSPSSSISSTTTASLMAATAHHSSSPAPSTSSPANGGLKTEGEDGSQVAGKSRKRSRSPKETSMGQTPKGEPQARRKPIPLNLDAASNLPMPSVSSESFNATQRLSAQFSPMLFWQNSPLFNPIMCALASASFYGAQMSPLMAATTSPFRSPLANSEVDTRTPNSQPQIFQFPPTSTFSTTSFINPLGLISPAAPYMINSPSSTTFKFPSSESLKTPTVPLKMPSQ